MKDLIQKKIKMESVISGEKIWLTILPKKRLELINRINRLSEYWVNKVVDIYIEEYYKHQNKDQFPTLYSFRIEVVTLISFYMDYYRNLLNLDSPFTTKKEQQLIIFIETYFRKIIMHWEPMENSSTAIKWWTDWVIWETWFNLFLMLKG